MTTNSVDNEHSARTHVREVSDAGNRSSSTDVADWSLVFLVAFVGSLVALPSLLSLVFPRSSVWPGLLGMLGASAVGIGLAYFGWRRSLHRPTPGSYPAARTAAIARLNRESAHLLGAPSASESLVNLWARFSTSDIVFGADARHRLDDVRAFEKALGMPLPRVFYFSREAFANAGYEDKRSPNQFVAYSDSRYQLKYWLMGLSPLLSFALVPLLAIPVWILTHWTLKGMFVGAWTFQNVCVSFVVAIGLTAALIFLVRPNFVLVVREGRVSLGRRSQTLEPLKTLDPANCVVVARMAMRPGFFVRIRPAIRWEFCQGNGLPLLLADDFSVVGTPWDE